MLPRTSRSIAITGANGQLGKELCRQLGSAAVPLPRDRLDITDRMQVRDTLVGMQPAVVINSAAWTAVEAAEQEAEACRRINADAVAALADACDAVGSLLVQVSTDYVFGADRHRTTPYAESDAIGPLNEYGRSKASGEAHARQCRRHLVVRVCGLYSVGDSGPVRGRNFLDTMLVLAGQRPELAVVNDQVCTPSYVPHVATGILQLVAAGAEGTFHLTNSGATSWHGLACELFRRAGMETVVKPIRTADYPSRAERPAWSVLDTGAFAAATGTTLPDWQAGVADYWAAASAWSPSRS